MNIEQNKSLGVDQIMDLRAIEDDLEILKTKLETKKYSNPWEYIDDVWFMFNNEGSSYMTEVSLRRHSSMKRFQLFNYHFVYSCSKSSSKILIQSCNRLATVAAKSMNTVHGYFPVIPTYYAPSCGMQSITAHVPGEILHHTLSALLFLRQLQDNSRE